MFINNKKLFFCLIFLFTIINDLAYAKTIKIAMVVPLTGNYSGYGIQLLAGASQAVKNINKVGGILGDPLEIIPYDDKCQPDLALNISKKLAKDKNIDVIIGHVTSSTTLAALDNYAKAGKLMITATATHPQITQKNISTVFRISGRNDRQGVVIAKFIAEKLHGKKIAILHEKDLYGKDLSDQVIEQLALLDKQPTLYQEIPRGTSDLSKIIHKFKELEIDVVFFAALYADVGNLAKAMYRERLQIPLITGDSITLNAFIIAAGSRHAAKSVIMSFGSDAKNINKNLNIIKEMRKGHLDTNGYSMYSYSAVQAIAAAMQATKSTNGKKLASWLHSNTVNTVLGVKSWDTNGDIIDSDYKMYMLDNYGRYTIVKYFKH